MYWGKLAKNTNDGLFEVNCVQYFILIYFPFTAGGGVFFIISSIVSFNLEVVIF